MSPLAQLETRQEAGAVVASIAGEVDISNASDLGAALEGSVSQRALGLVLDLWTRPTSTAPACTCCSASAAA